jgi:hypothetical protein
MEMELKEVNNKSSKDSIIITEEDFIKAVKEAFPQAQEKGREVETKVLHTHFGTILINKIKD